MAGNFGTGTSLPCSRSLSAPAPASGAPPDATRGTRVLPRVSIPQTRRVSLEHALHFIAHPAEAIQNFLLAAGGLRGIEKWPLMPVQLAGEDGTDLIRIAADGDDGGNGLI